MRTFETTDDFYDPDCDHVMMPVPDGGNVEGEDGYSCDGDGDCHLIVFDKTAAQLYEMWRANITGGTFYGGCLAVWNTLEVYTDTLRGDQCTSADAAGFPIAPLLFDADEVAAGTIDHAIRFILPNDRMQARLRAPGDPRHRHAPAARTRRRTASTSGCVPTSRSTRCRAKARKVVARALQKYGMYHADGGNIALTAQSDRYTTAKWDGLLGPRDLAALTVEDFDVIDHGAMIPLTLDCNR